ncbi:MAG: PorV/PorQ family protein [Elusimicrobia bacterium]|nr:PorV/PorQ family protein [Elusimicrobiota bacterium]
MGRLAGLLVVLALLRPLPARGEAGLSGAETLARPLGARATAMGTAFAAVDGGVDSLAYNPAGISTAAHAAVQTSYTRGIADDYFSYGAYVQPLPFGVLAVGGMYYDAGTIHLTLSDGSDRFVKAQQDYVEMLGLGLNLGRGLSAGGLVKVYQLSLGGEARASGYAFDGGLLWHSPVTGLNVGGSVQNLGPDVKFESAKDHLPMVYRGGLAYLLDLERFTAFSDMSTFFTRYLFTAEAIAPARERTAAGAGLEMDMPFAKTNHAFLRVGYIFNRDLDGITFGVGFREKHFTADYALGGQRTVGDVHRFSIGYEF